MFRIAICDDEEYFRQDLQELVSSYMIDQGYTFQIDTFCSGEEFMSLGMEMINYTIVFLDINMDEINGVTVAKEIRKISKEAYIVFVTAYVDYALEGYKVDVIRYLLKDNNSIQNAVRECMDAIVEKMGCVIVKKEFTFHEGGRKAVSLERLVYIESKLHKLEFHVMEDSMKIYTMYATLNDIETELDHKGFIRVHQSFLVNLKYVINVFRYKAILCNGEELVIPKARYKEVKDSFIAYQGEL